MFDSHSKNEKGECCPNGFSTVLKFSCRSALESHIVKNYLTVDDGNTQFEIQYIMVTNMNGSTIYQMIIMPSKRKNVKLVTKRKSVKLVKAKNQNVESESLLKPRKPNVGNVKRHILKRKKLEKELQTIMQK